MAEKVVVTGKVGFVTVRVRARTPRRATGNFVPTVAANRTPRRSPRQNIWHPRENGSPIPNILRYDEPPRDIWYPLQGPNILVQFVPHCLKEWRMCTTRHTAANCNSARCMQGEGLSNFCLLRWHTSHRLTCIGLEIQLNSSTTVIHYKELVAAWSVDSWQLCLSHAWYREKSDYSPSRQRPGLSVSSSIVNWLSQQSCHDQSGIHQPCHHDRLPEFSA